jgi:uncharacterized protein YqjF (DUF2071 family)
LGDFDEVDVRLYSKDALGRRGVVFRLLDCGRVLPVLAARAAFGLPYPCARTSRRWYGDRLCRAGLDAVAGNGPPVSGWTTAPLGWSLIRWRSS